MTMFADISFTTEGIVVIGSLLAAIAAAYTKVGLLLLAAKDDRYSDMKSQRGSYREMNEELLATVELKVKNQPGNLPLVAPLVAVVPEHSSPATTAQKETAALQTHRARVTAAKLALNLPPRSDG